MDLIGDLNLMMRLADAGSFSKVGQVTGQAPSSIARRLDRLEEQVGERLFNRTPKGLFLTDIGQRKLAEARKLTDAAEAFVARDGVDGIYTGHLVVSAPSRLGERYVAEAVAAFLQDNPAASIDLHLTDTLLDLDRHQIDLSVRIGRNAADHHIRRCIVANRRILVASAGYEAARGKIETVGDLEAHDALFLGSAQFWSLVHEDGTTATARPRTRFRAVAGDVVLEMCRAGLGVALKSFWDVRQALAQGEVVRILPQWQQADPADIMIVMPSRHLLSPTLKAFSTHLDNHLKTALHDAYEQVV